MEKPSGDRIKGSEFLEETIGEDFPGEFKDGAH